MNVNETSSTTPEQKSCWYRITPERFVWLLLVLEIFLWLSDRYCWFFFNESKNLAVVLSIGLAGIAVLRFMLWYVSALLNRRQFQFSIRTLFILTLVVAVPFSWLALEIRRTKDRQKAVDYFGAKFDIETRSWITLPSWSKSLLGDLFFSKVLFFCSTENQQVFSDEDMKQCCEFDELEFGDFSRSVITDSGLENIGNLTRLRYLDLRDTAITDASLKHLENLLRLETLDLTGTNTTEAGVIELQSKLPHCKISM